MLAMFSKTLVSISTVISLKISVSTSIIIKRLEYQVSNDSLVMKRKYLAILKSGATDAVHHQRYGYHH